MGTCPIEITPQDLFMLKSGKLRKQRRKMDIKAYNESNDNQLLMKITREQEAENAQYELWKRGG